MVFLKRLVSNWYADKYTEGTRESWNIVIKVNKEMFLNNLDEMETIFEDIDERESFDELFNSFSWGDKASRIQNEIKWMLDEVMEKILFWDSVMKEVTLSKDDINLWNLTNDQEFALNMFKSEWLEDYERFIKNNKVSTIDFIISPVWMRVWIR